MWKYPFWEEIRRRSELFNGAVAYFPDRFDLSPGGRSEFVSGLWASGSFFDVLGVTPVLGRTLSESDDRKGGGPDSMARIQHGDLWVRSTCDAPT